MNILGGLHNSQKLLLYFTQKGLSRQKSYLLIQEAAMESLESETNFMEVLMKEKKINKYIDKKDLQNLFDINDELKYLEFIFKKVFK